MTETAEVVHAFHHLPKCKWSIKIHSIACRFLQHRPICNDTALRIDLCKSKYGVLMGIIDGVETGASKSALLVLDRIFSPLDNRSVNKSLRSQSVGGLGPRPPVGYLVWK